jgi:hypothetical protein
MTRLTGGPMIKSNYVEEMELNVKLGLENQVKITSDELISAEIREPTNSGHYYPITRRQLDGIFHLGRLRGLCVLNNIVAALRAFANPWYRPILAGVIPALLCVIIPAILASPLPEEVRYTGVFILSFISIIAMIMAIFVPIFRAEFSSIALKIESIRDTKIKIPRGAKLKILEATEKGVFDDYVIAYPKVDTTEFTLKLLLPNDPAILGVTHDKTMYMICYWDIQKDIDIAVKISNCSKNIRLWGANDYNHPNTLCIRCG